MSKILSLPVIKVSQPLGDFFIGSMRADDLVLISYADVRRIEERDVEKYLGIQRPLDKSRIKKIRKYLESPDATFPTGVVIAIDEKCAEYDPDTNQLTLKSFESDFPGESIQVSKIAKVLDGQHRIYAFVDEDGNFDLGLGEKANLKNFEFNCVIFVGIDIDEQANIFATVNLAQTKVNKSLVYDLEGLSRARSPFKTCHHIAVALDDSDPNGPLFQRIKRLGVRTQGRKKEEPLTQAGFVESLLKLIANDPFGDRTLYLRGKKPTVASTEELQKLPFRNLFIEEKDMDIALILYNYFSAVKKHWPIAWNGIDREGNILPKSNAFRALMRFLRVVYLRIVGDEIGSIPTVDQFYEVFSEINVSDKDLTTGLFKPGSGGEAAFYKLLTGETSIEQLKES